MRIIQQVFDMSEVILANDPIHVWVNPEGIQCVANSMKVDGKKDFYESEPEQEPKSRHHIEIIKELVASSINYCYWYGKHDIRPNGISSSMMYDDVNSVFDDGKALMLERRIQDLIEVLSKHRYTLLEKRKKHLLELIEGRKCEQFASLVYSLRDDDDNVLFEEMIRWFQGFASDQFLKRASLFLIQLYRKFGWFKDTYMERLFVPADYQVPKILRHFDCIRYSDKLSKKIKLGKIIRKHSLEELQIRAATIKACNSLKLLTGWNISDIDTYLWTQRKLSDNPFHLTYTTDY